ncbi:hypothetical protein PSU4_31070 [Pseudonocardia sulfidoxydans NBRC 16205]|uniref:Uncharacterized protein n=1 Tax=Pseudonocardia sulfidoxydans NBRC 16205 TaxID=1223511 RepID=A0A511DIM2_9PSEU|nr:hypothetical protein [Pseudonocardia sulfidoxydans]GEL24153.1 hypothetical protein PSU4_31070 [Pseudonocardia sulfidoxydans NBRC 16205]
MAEPISDAAVVAVLRPFVRAARPVLAGLRDADPFGLRVRPAREADADRDLRDKLLDGLAKVKVPGTARWASMSVQDRCEWWVYRVGRVTTIAAAVPGLGGALARSLPVSSTVGAAGQGLLLVAIAGEHGVDDENEVIALLGHILFERDLAPRTADAQADAAADARADEMTGDLRDDDGRSTARRVTTALWRMGRALYAVEDELDKRPHGRFYHDAVGLLPGVGAVGKYFGEWSGLKRASKKAHRRLAAHR